MSSDQIAATADRPTTGPLRVRVPGPLIVAAAVLAAALLGIALRPVGLLSAFWPANAVLLGLMVRWPRLATGGNPEAAGRNDLIRQAKTRYHRGLA